MTTTTIDVSDNDVIKLVLEFLGSRSFDISLLSLERETGVINGAYSEDALFLRQLIMDGQWDDALDFVKPLTLVEEFDSKKFHYLIVRYKYLELLCLKSEPGPMQQNDFTLEEVVKCLSILEELCPDKKEFSSLCYLLTLPKLSQHEQYKDWNPCSARVQCFSEVYPLVRPFIPPDRESYQSATENRLVQLLVKGILYEACIDYCQQKAVGNVAAEIDVSVPRVLTDGAPCCDADLSLLSWLQSIPQGTFSCPFEQKSLKLRTTRLEKPSLQAAWSEHILLTPIKPNIFPHSAMPPKTRPAEALSRSLTAQYDGLSYGLARNNLRPQRPGGRGKSSLLSASHSGAFRLSNSFTRDRRHDRMSASVEKLFASAADISTARLLKRDSEDRSLIAGGSESCPATCLDRDQANTAVSQDSRPVTGAGVSDTIGLAQQTPKGERLSVPVASPLIAPAPVGPERQQTRPPQTAATPRPEAAGDHTARSSAVSVENGAMSSHKLVRESVGELYSEYQKQKQRIHEQLEEHERLRETMWQQLQDAEGAADAGDVTGSTRVSNSTTRGHAEPEIQHKVPAASAASVQFLSGSVGQPLQEIYEEGEHLEVSSEVADESLNKFVSLCTLEDTQAIRAAAFHPDGSYFAVGANSKVLRVCRFPDIARFGRRSGTGLAEVVSKHNKLHKGSIYCLAWNSDGRLIASGSNDHKVKLLSFDTTQPQALGGTEVELAMHDGTVRDLTFMSDRLLVSGGAGNNRAYVADCSVGTVVRELSGHTAPILAVHSWSPVGHLFVTGSQDKTARVWDTRAAASILHFVAPDQVDSAFASVCVEASGRVLASGHEDSSCLLFDIRGGRLLQHWRPHDDEVRCLQFSPTGLYLLTTSYDGKVKLADAQGDLTVALPTVEVAKHSDKIIQCRWHPQLLAFVTTSADKTATCWAIPVQ